MRPANIRRSIIVDSSGPYIIRAGTRVTFWCRGSEYPAFSGLDSQTLNREVHRTLETQAIPEQPAPESDRTTAYLYYAALAEALEPGKPARKWNARKSKRSGELLGNVPRRIFTHAASALFQTVSIGGNRPRQSCNGAPDGEEGRIERVVFNGPLSPYGRSAARLWKSACSAQTLSVSISLAGPRKLVMPSEAPQTQPGKRATAAPTEPTTRR